MRLGFAFAALALAASAAPAQIVPGLRAPTSTADAMMMSHLALCTLAAAGRPTPGLTMDLMGGEGMTQFDALPESIAPFIQVGPDTRIVEIETPGDPLWAVFDQSERRCTLASFTNKEAVKSELVDTLATPDSWQPREIEVADGDADYAFTWNLAGTGLDTLISLPDDDTVPVLVILQPTD